MSAPPAQRAVSLLAGRIGGVAGALAASQLLVGLTYVLGARSMPPAGLGIIATCFAVATIAETVFDLGLTNHLVREIASHRLDGDEARALVRTKRLFGPLLTLPVLVVCLLVAPDPAVAVALALVAPCAWEAASANSLLRARERFSVAATGQLAGRASGVVATVVLLLSGVVALALPIGLVLGFAVEALVDRVFLGRSSGGRAPVDVLVRTQRASLSFGLAAIAAMGQFLDTPLVAAGGGAADAGLYAGAGRLLGPLLFLSSALAMVGLPWLAAAGRDPERMRAEERRIARVSSVIALAPLGTAALGPLVIPWVLGEAYAASGSVFAVLAVGAVFSTLNQGMAIVLQNRGHESSVARAIAIGLVLGLVLTYVLAALAGPVWAAAGYAASQIYMVAHLAVRRRATAGDLPPVAGQ